jgi:hypothetical protein
MTYPIGRNDIINETGHRYGKLLVIKQATLPHKHNASWECLCNCGNTVIVAGANLRNGNTKSCGCLTGKLPKGEASFRCLVLQYKNNAKKRNLKFQLSNNQLKQLFCRPCFYCNSPPITTISGNRTNGSFTYNGIDRIDNNKGYTIDNCISCCKICNRAKGDMDQVKFLVWLQGIVATHKI